MENPTSPHTVSGAQRQSYGKFRRRPASGAEQQRRKAWGTKWGNLNAAYWKIIHEKERGA